MAREDETTDDADRHVFLGLMLALFWVPLPVGSNHLWAWSFFEVCIFTLAISWLVLFAAGRASSTAAFRRAWPALLLFIAVFAWVLLQLAPLPPSLIALLSPSGAEIYGHTQTTAALSLDPAGTRAAALKTLAYGLLFALTLLLINRPGRLRMLAWVLVASGVFQAVFGGVMALSGFKYGFFIEKFSSTGVVTGTFVNPDHLAGYLGLCLALGIGLMLAGSSASKASGWRHSARRLLAQLLSKRALGLVVLLIMFIGLALSESRMGNLAFFSSLLLVGSYYVIVGKNVHPGIMAVLVVASLIAIFFIGSVSGLDRIAAESSQNSNSVAAEASRIGVARDTLQIVRDYPLTGTGAGSFASTYPMYDSGQVGFWHYKNAHNDYLQFASEFGIPGLAMLAGIVLLSLWHAARAQVKRYNRLMRGLGFGVLIAIVAMLIFSFVNFNLQIPANAATFVVILAMAWLTRWLGKRAPAAIAS